LFLSFVFLVCSACGGSTPPAASPPTPTADANPNDAPKSVNSADSAIAPSVVRFDDLGVSFAVPPGMRVIGDDELSAQIRSSANPRVTAELKDRAAQGKGLPLLTLASEKATATDRWGLTLMVAVVPDDAKVSELMDHQLGVLKENLTDFAVIDGPTDKTLDGVAGSELADAYVLRGDNGVATKTHARMRLFVRKGRAFILAAAWPESAAPETDARARALLEGLHFYDPAP